LRVLFSGLALLALIWASFQCLWEMQGVSPEHRGEVMRGSVFMYIPVGILLVPVVALSNAFGTHLATMLHVFSLEQIGIVSVFCLVLALFSVILWIFTTDSETKKLFVDGIKTTVFD